MANQPTSPADTALLPLPWRKEFARREGTGGDDFLSCGCEEPPLPPPRHLQAPEPNPVKRAKLEGAEYLGLN